MKRVLCVLCAGLLLFLAGCGAQKTEKHLFAMDTAVTLTAYGPDAPDALEDASREITRLEGLFSVTAKTSDIAAINHTSYAEIQPETAELLQKAQAYAALTDGAFDPTVYPLVRAWGFTTDTKQVPSQETIDALLPFVDYRKLTVTDSEASVADGTQLDLGGIAKGYVGQKAAELLRARGVKSAVLALGGNVQTVGTRTDGTPWKIAVQNPFDRNGYAGTLAVTDSAVVTSGIYERYFEENGVHYHHIIDPKTGYPAASDLASVTVVCADGALADALSTALLVMGAEKAMAFWSERRDFGAVLITTDRRILTTEGLAFTETEGAL